VATPPPSRYCGGREGGRQEPPGVGGWQCQCVDSGTEGPVRKAGSKCNKDVESWVGLHVLDSLAW
jgi:hypothetical protein